MPGMNNVAHQYVERATESVADERLLANKLIRALYSPKLENAPLLWKLASSRYVSEVLGYLNYDNALSARVSGMRRFLRTCGIDASELAGGPGAIGHVCAKYSSAKFATGNAGRCRERRGVWCVRPIRG